MVDSRNNGNHGRRRSSNQFNSEAENTNNNKSSSDATSTISASGGGGLDALLRRLDDMDLKTPSVISGGVASSSNRSRKAGTVVGDAEGVAESNATSGGGVRTKKKPLARRAGLLFVFFLIIFIIFDAKMSPPEKRIFGAHRMQAFLQWVKEHPGTGAAAFVLVYGMCVALLLPGTPLTLGGGYVYKVAYGWVGGVAMATATSMAGSLFGSCFCFILGRYIMRDRVRKWGRKYPLFDAIDLAVSDNGFKIMCLLYLTPILPLGPVSYMCGTTSMPLMKFAAAKIAALPLMLVYVFIGASTDTLVLGTADTGGETKGAAGSAGHISDETHRKMVFFGLCLSVISMSTVSHFVKKELYKVFDKQKKKKGDGKNLQLNPKGEHIEVTTRTDNLLRRPRGFTAGSTDAGMPDEEKG